MNHLNARSLLFLRTDFKAFLELSELSHGLGLLPWITNEVGFIHVKYLASPDLNYPAVRGDKRNSLQHRMDASLHGNVSLTGGQTAMIATTVWLTTMTHPSPEAIRVQFCETPR